MKIILLQDAGGATTLRLQKRTMVVVGLLLCLGLLAVALRPQGISADDPAVGKWRVSLAAQKSEIRSLERQARAEAAAIGRQLALLQARLTRMEALGSRVVEVAQLESDEFSFSHPPALGGPDTERDGADDGAAGGFANLQQTLEKLSLASFHAERDIEVIDSLLRDKDFQKVKAVAGRPISWGWMSSPYGERVDPISGKSAWHKGVDFAGKKGSDVIAVASGVVTHAGPRYGYGLMVEITHSDGYVTRYGHHQEVLVSVGDVVTRGQAIALMGSSGRSTGPHVHFEVMKDGRTVNPAKYVASQR